MAEQGKFKPILGRFGATNTDEMQKILEERNSSATVKSTKNAMTLFKAYLTEKELGLLEDLPNKNLPSILKSFYTDARTKNGELYHVQTMKSLQSNMNRWFKEHRDINIVNDKMFNQANNMFQGVKVRSKNAGKGVRRSTPTITDEDMERLAHYFFHDHFTSPNPKLLQKNIIFNYMCRRGQENLYSMKQDWFKVCVNPESGQKYLIQVMDELDKNHREDDFNPTNQGKMYDVEGK